MAEGADDHRKWFRLAGRDDRGVRTGRTGSRQGHRGMLHRQSDGRGR